MANDPFEGMSEVAKQSTLAKIAKSESRSKASKLAAATREENKLKQQLANAPKPDPSKFDALGSTPEERKANARKLKIAEIQQAEAKEKTARTEKRKAAAKKAAATRKSKKAPKSDDLRDIVKAIQATSVDKAVKIIENYIKTAK